MQIGAKYINKGGSFTLTTGILNVEPIALGVVAATVNVAVEGFVQAATLEYKDFRINTVSPTVVKESLAKYGSFFVGYEPIEAEKVANICLKSVAGLANGIVIKVVIIFNYQKPILYLKFLIILTNLYTILVSNYFYDYI